MTSRHFLVIGLGSIGRRHAQNLQSRYPDARVTALRHGGDADGIGRGLGVCVVESLADVIDEDVDLAVVATPSANHIDVLPDLIGRGWPLLVEKPVVTEMADVDATESLLSVAPPALRVAGFNLRYLPSLVTMKRHLDRGDVGNVVRASFEAGQWLPDWRPGGDYRASYSADAARGGGVELDLSHEFDAARWLFGELDVEFARCGTFSQLEINSNDTAAALLTPSGRGGPIISVTLDYVSRRRVRRYEIVGESGTLRWDLDGTLSVTTEAGQRTLPVDADAFDVAGTYVTMIGAVMDAIDGSGDDVVQTLGDGVSSTRLALAVRDRGGRR